MRMLELHERFFLYNMIEAGYYSDQGLAKNPAIWDVTSYVQRYTMGYSTPDEVKEWLDERGVARWTTCTNLLPKQPDDKTYRVNKNGTFDASSYAMMKELVGKLMLGEITVKSDVGIVVKREERIYDNDEDGARTTEETQHFVMKPGDSAILYKGTWEFFFLNKPETPNE
jgi:hypothetical protein